MNQRDYLSPSGVNFAAIPFNCSCLSTFVGHSFQFGIHFIFGRHLFRLIFILLVSLAMISPCDSLFQYFDDFAYAERSFQSLLKIFKTQLLPVIFICLSIFTLSTNFDCNFRRARIDFLTQIFLRVIQPGMRIAFGLGNERPSFRRAGSSHEDQSLLFFSPPLTFLLSAIQQSYSISIFAVSSMVESSSVWAIKGRLLDALAHSSTSSRYLSFFAFELI